MEGLRALPDSSAGDWIDGRLRGFGSTVACTVPTGFAACARLFHPVDSLPTPTSAPTSRPPSTEVAPVAEATASCAGTAQGETTREGATLTWAQVCRRTGRAPRTP